jgi:predicted nucleic acid-binding protein
MARIVIADAGPLIALARIGHLELLSKLFGSVSVTSIVAAEVLQGGDFPDGSVLSQAFAQTWLQRVNADSADQLSQAKSLMNLYQIDPGEASSMVLAQQAHAQGDQALMVMDDLRGRSAAQHARLPVVGTTGVLLLAKRQGQVTHVTPLLLNLRQNGYFLSQRLIDSALQQAGE